MSDEVLIVETFGGVVRLTLNRPRAMNALNGALVGAFNAALDQIEVDHAARAVILTGQGPAFCAGADLKEALPAVPEPEGEDFLARASALMVRLRGFPKPVVAALNGLTLAGGLELALCADILIAADTAMIGDAHANFGVFPGAGGAAMLPRQIPLNAALYLLLSGRSVSADRLYQLGLVSELHPADALAEAALTLAQDIAGKSPGALRRMKTVARGSADASADDALAHEQRQLREHLQSEDLKEGLAAFAEKRQPQFTGR
jgi:enoyl-CoA hydratase/carnithine racemase